MTRLYDILNNLALRTQNDVEFIEDTRTSASSTLSGTSTIVSLVNGTRIAFHMQYNVASDASLILTLKDGTTTSSVPIYKHGSTRMSNFTFAGAILPMTYLSPYKVEGTTIANAAWLLDCGSGGMDVYDDTTVVTPNLSFQTLNTAGKYMPDNVRVREISVYDEGTAMSNGRTIRIGDFT